MLTVTWFGSVIVCERIVRTVFLIGLLICAALYFVKDRLPDPGFYDLGGLRDPVQSPTDENSFSIRTSGQEYRIDPRYEYRLEGVIVSLHDADDFTDIYHHERWKDFINLRDLCVIWGSNVASGVYRDMDFENGTWTCRYAWPSREVGARFDASRLSNNHLLIDDDNVKRALMRAEPGDHIRLSGMLVEYRNPASGFRRGTSIRRDDTGNGACETIYVDEFEIVNKANPRLRILFALSWWTTMTALAGVILLFFLAPYRGRYHQA